MGERQQRLLRELEKLALASSPEGEGESTHVSAQDIEARAAHSTEWRAYALADSLVGADGREATLSYLRLRQQGERLSGLTYLMAQRLRDALAVAQPARAAERFVADVARSDVERLRAALSTLAELELDTRGGAPLASSRTPHAGLDEDTLALRAIEAVTG